MRVESEPMGESERVSTPPIGPTEARVEFSLEIPRTLAIERGQITEQGDLFLAGWCFSVSGDPVELTARVGDAAPRTTVANGLRPDVGRVHASVPSAAQSGFGMLVPLPSRPGPARCRIEASVLGDTRVVAEIELDFPAPFPIRDPRAAVPRRRPRAEAAQRRVLFVSHGLNLEGAPRSLFETARALDASRFEKRLLSPVPGPLEAAWDEARIPVSLLEVDLALACRDDFDAQIRRLAGLVSVWRPDLIVANTLETHWAVHVAAELGRPAIWIVRESEDPDAYFHSRWPTPIAECARAALDLADRVVFVADATRQLFEDSLAPGRDRLIPNGLDPSRFDLSSLDSHRAAIRRELRLSGQTPLLLCVGTTCMRKGQLELIRALGVLRASRSDFHCVFLGVVEGEYLEAMRHAIRELDLAKNVSLLRPVQDARPYFAACDVAVCPSFQESLPRVVLEAMAFARPIVASRVFGIPELVREEVDGLLVEAGDVGSMANAIERLLADPSKARALGSSARQQVEERFSLSRCAGLYSDLIDEVLDGTLDDAFSGMAS